MSAKSGYQRLARIYQRKHNKKAVVKHIAKLFWLADLDIVNADMGKRGFWNRVPGLHGTHYEQEPKLRQNRKRRVGNKIKQKNFMYASS